MSFFDSDVVRAEMTEISELQEDVYRNVFKFPSMNNEEKLFHVSMLERLVDKQKILYTRLSLSDDPEAKQMKEKLTKCLGSNDTYETKEMIKKIMSDIDHPPITEKESLVHKN